MASRLNCLDYSFAWKLLQQYTKRWDKTYLCGFILPDIRLHHLFFIVFHIAFFLDMYSYVFLYIMLCMLFLQAASFSARLTDLEDSADELSALSQSNSEVMATLQVRFDMNSSVCVCVCLWMYACMYICEYVHVTVCINTAFLQEGLFSNIQTFKENLETLDSRINKLS